MKKERDGRNTASVGEMLAGIITEIERLEVEKKVIADDIKDVYADAKGRGFDTKIIKELIAERKLPKVAVLEHDAVKDMYRAALGMLNGTPLGDAARKRLSRKDDEDDAGDGGGPKQETESNGIGEEEIARARAAGAKAYRDGKRVIDNPHTAGDPRRAAWDEGWCEASGTDGMDIPKAWRRKKEEKPAKPAKDGGGKDGEGAEA